MATLTLQPDETTGADTFINVFSPTVNYGASLFLDVGKSDAGSVTEGKGLIRFDLSSIPPGMVITSAILTLYCYTEMEAADHNVSVHRSLVQWFEGTKTAQTPGAGESGSTWNLRNHNGSVAWAGGAGGAAGSDYASSPTATTPITEAIGASGAPFDWNVTVDVQNFYSGTQTNHGWWLIGANATKSLKGFRVSGSSASVRPKLVITYSEPPNPEISGTAAGLATVIGTLMGVARIEGSSAGTSIATGTLQQPGTIEGESAGLAVVTGTLSGIGLLRGSADSLATISGTLHAIGNLAGGAAVGIATTTAYIIGGASIAGSANGSATTMATGNLAGILRGVSAGVATVLGLGVAYARSVARPIVRNPAPLLYLTDGMERFDLLDRRTGYMLCSWRPAIAQYKGGGQWSDSSLAHGRRLVMRRFANAIEVMELSASGKDQDALIGYTRDLLQWIEAAADYWSSRWATRPIYLVARSAYEDNTRYAIIHAGSIPELEDVYAQPFFTSARRTPGPGRSVFNNITLRLERGPWLDLPPGNGSCVAVSSIRSWTVAGWVSGAGE